MTLLQHHKTETHYWLKVFAFYALIEACIQVLFLLILNNFGIRRISIPEYHLVMLFFQCLLIVPIWWVAWLVRKKKIIIQVIANLSFYVVYSIIWFGPVQDAIAFLYNNLQEITRPVTDRQVPYLDRGNEYSFLNYQLLKHAFRLSWFYLANYFYNYRLEEKKKTALAVSNKELQLKLLKWHLNPSFYFKTIKHLQQSAAKQPSNATGSILQLAKVMEYVIYEAREPQIEMKKEIQFLSNYIQLINQQPDNDIQILLEYEGQHEQLKIAPLLLAGFVDTILNDSPDAANGIYKISVKFTGTEMLFSVAGAFVKPAEPPLLEELYKGKYSSVYSSAEKTINLRIQLLDAV
jgi:Histidine kinase